MSSAHYNPVDVETRCPGCGAFQTGCGYKISQQPVVLNYRFADAEEAMRVQRADIVLYQCSQCALVYNHAFDPRLVPYDPRYNNDQSHSPAFVAHLEAMASDFAGRYHLSQKRILEVGCGKGQFLKLICGIGHNTGVGFDTTYEGEGEQENPRISFFRRYVHPVDIQERFDAIVCRHVIEHVPDCGEFLGELEGMSRAAGGAVTALETPAFEWIVRAGAFWDIFYEHNNYFSLATLRFLSQRAGFDVLDQRLVFGGQYQWIELKPGNIKTNVEIDREAIPRLEDLIAKAEEAQRRLGEQLRSAGAAEGWALWGAGAKGVALVNQLSDMTPAFVIDSNPAKQGCVIPGSSVRILPPQAGEIDKIKVVLVANPNYLQEITAFLRSRGFRGEIVSL